MNGCVKNFDHFNDYLEVCITQANRKHYFILTLVSFIGSLTFLFICIAHLETFIGEYQSTYEYSNLIMAAAL